MSATIEVALVTKPNLGKDVILCADTVRNKRPIRTIESTPRKEKKLEDLL